MKKGDEMRILALADTHGAIPIPQVEADLVLCLGDIDYYELRKIDQLYSCPKVGVLGNHDAPDFFESAFQTTSIINVHQKVVNVSGITIAGFEGCPRYNQRTFLQYEEEDVVAFTHLLSKVDIFIAHSNPR